MHRYSLFKKLVIIALLLTVIVGYQKNNVFSVTIEKNNYYTGNSSLSNEELYAGYGKKITSPLAEHVPIPLRGYGSTQYRTSTMASEDQAYGSDLYATAIAIGNDNVTMLFVTIDICDIPDELRDGIREKIISEATNANLSRDKIMISATHTHSAPDIRFSNSSYPELTENVKQYLQYLINQASAACIEALNEYKSNPSKVYYGSVNVVNEQRKNVLNFTRHYNTSSQYRDGTALTSGDNHGSFGWDSGNNVFVSASNRINHTTIADNTLQVIKFVSSSNKADILLVNFQAHPTITGGSTNTVVSSDFVGCFRDALTNNANYSSLRVAYFTGAAGNVNTNTLLDSEKTEESTAQTSKEDKKIRCDKYGSKLASYVTGLLESNTLQQAKIKSIKNKFEEYELPINSKEDTNEELVKNATYLQKINSATWDDFKKMIDGTYNWNLTDFPTDLDGNTYSADGKNLAKFIKRYTGANSLLGSSITIEGNDQDGYSATLSPNVTRNSIYNIVSLLGSNFKERIYSVFHASAVVRNSKIEDGSTLKIELDTINFGDISFVTIPNEVFHETGSNIKENSPNPMTFVLSITNGGNGYLPSKAAFEYGCYEADTTRFKKGTAENLATKLVANLNELNTQQQEEVKVPNTSKNATITKIIEGIIAILIGLGIIMFTIKRYNQKELN